MASEIKSVYQVLEECDLEMQLDHLFFDAYHHKSIPSIITHFIHSLEGRVNPNTLLFLGTLTLDIESLKKPKLIEGKEIIASLIISFFLLYQKCLALNTLESIFLARKIKKTCLSHIDLYDAALIEELSQFKPFFLNEKIDYNEMEVLQNLYKILIHAKVNVKYVHQK